MRNRRCFVGAVMLALALSTPAWAAPGVVGTIERNAGRLAGTRIAERQVTAISRPGFTVSIRPRHKVIVVQRGLFRRQGFFLGRDGKLSTGDRAALGRMLRQHAPGATASTVRQGLLGSIRKFKVKQRQLRRQDPLINSLLRRAAGTSGSKDRVLWQGSHGSLTYRPSANVLVGSSLTSRKGFFLSRGPGGLTVQSHYQDGLRQFLLQQSR